MGDIVAFHPVDAPHHPNGSRQLLRRALVAQVPLFAVQLLLLQGLDGVMLRHLYQLFLLSPFGADDLHLRTPLFRKPALDQLLFLPQRLLHQDELGRPIQIQVCLLYTSRCV